MDQTKPQRNARPTVKLGDINFTPVYIALLVVLISIGTYLGFGRKHVHLFFVITNATFRKKLFWFYSPVTALYFLWKKKSQKRTDLLLTGLCESGKTVIFSQLLHNEARETFTSITENVGEYTMEENGAVLRVIDSPGHERLRGRFFDQYKATVKGIIFVIDSVTVQKDVRDVAEYVAFRDCLLFYSRMFLLILNAFPKFLP